MDKTEDIEALGNKYNRIIGTGFIVIAVLIICINMVCRFVGSRRSMVIDYSHAYEYIRKGDVLRVYYEEDDPDEAYPARKDWLTGKYLPAENDYNIPLIISVPLIAIGIYFFIDDENKKERLDRR